MPDSKRRATTGRKKTISSPNGAVPISEWVNEALAVFFGALAAFLLISITSLRWVAAHGQSYVTPSAHPMGPVGHFLGTTLFGFLGWTAFVPVLWLIWLSRLCWVREDLKVKEILDTRKLGARLMALLGVVAVVTLCAAFFTIILNPSYGGSLGTSIAQPAAKLFGNFGTAVILGALLIAACALAGNTSVTEVVLSAFKLVYTVLHFVFTKIPSGLCWLLSHIGNLLSSLFQRTRSKELDTDFVIPKPRLRKNSLKSADIQEELAEDEDSSSQSLDQQIESRIDDDKESGAVVQRKEFDLKKQKEYEKIWKKVAQKDLETQQAESYAGYVRPSLSILQRGERIQGSEDDEELKLTSKVIEAKLRDFGIAGKVTQIHPGPVITLYEYEPAPGVKVGKIASLADDLAMGLRASSIRIIAPIPKRGTVGIEVPNRNREIVRLRDVLESETFIAQDSVVSVALGKDTYGDPVVVDISSMPHLLIAGSTGTGKSVCINALILSLLYRSHPSELGLIMIDPKILELSVYEDIPHLRVPVVTVPRQAKAVLEWAINEMNRRYRMMQKFGVRSIDGYNKIANGTEERSDFTETGLDKNIVVLSENEVVEPGTVQPNASDPSALDGQDTEFKEQLQPLPKIVIIVDELADLMLSVGRDIEELITRLAQKARAAGIHLILATQRPSVDVITGLIKANFPARLSFRVSSRIDSRTILDSMGAERLLGKGDMLCMFPGGEGGLRRIHGAFCSDTEVKATVAAIKAYAKPHYDERIMALCQKAMEEDPNLREGENSNSALDEYDEMYDKCVELVTQKGQASTSMLQRAFRLGYNRAARIIDMMEREGVIGPMDGAKPREVLVQTGNQPE